MKVWEQMNSIASSLEEDLAQAKATGNEEAIRQAQQELDDFTHEANVQMRD